LTRDLKRGFAYGFLSCAVIWISTLLVPLFMPKAVSRTLFSFLDISTPPKKADYLFVPSGSLFYRLPFAIDLLNQHLGDTLVLTVTEPARWRREIRNDSDEDLTEGSLVFKLLRSRGITGDTQVLFLGESRSTWQDARLFSDFLSKHPHATAIAVSDGYHLRRIRLSVNRTNSKVGDRTSYAASSTFDDLLHRDTEYSDAYQQVFKEWIKLIFYAVGRA